MSQVNIQQKYKKLTFSTGKSVVIRVPTMKDHRISMKEMPSSSNPNPNQALEVLIRFLIEKVTDKDGNDIEIGNPPVNFDNFLEYQEYMEMMICLNDQDVICDPKKKPQVETLTNL